MEFNTVNYETVAPVIYAIEVLFFKPEAIG
jgi:hypothetical protein